jgi:hypothetical protein
MKVPNGYCPIHATDVKLPDDFAATRSRTSSNVA